MKDQMLWISFNWLLISYAITYGCAEMLSDVLDAFDYSFWQLGLKTAGRHFLICNGLPWCANKNRQLDEWSSAYLMLLSCSAVLKANTIRDQPGKEQEKLQKAEGFSACRSALLSAPRHGEPGSRDVGMDKAKVPIRQGSRRGRSDYFCIAGVTLSMPTSGIPPCCDHKQASTHKPYHHSPAHTAC